MYVKSVHFQNIKAFEDVCFEFGYDGKFAGWQVFVGGNSSGKSTVLKGVALAIAGRDEGRVLLRNVEGWLRHETLKGSVLVEIQPDPAFDKVISKGPPRKNPFETSVHWEREQSNDIPLFRSSEKRQKIKEIEKGLLDPNASGWFSAGYGPMRRLTGSSADAVRDATSKGIVSRMVTLFREDAALSESEEWLKKTQSRVREQEPGEANGQQKLLDGVIKFLNSGLLPLGFQLHKVTVDEVILKSPNGLELPMRDLSDGCRSVYAFILDLIHSFHEAYRSEDIFDQSEDGTWFVNKPAVVLIDEVEAHLHPSWQRTFPEWLKTRFPLVQFLVTTHSPLILQAADPGGIYVLPLQNELDRQPRRLDDHEYEKIVLGKAGKILLGEAFGLHHTLGNWAIKQIERWKLLNAKHKAGAKLSGAEQKEFRSLKPQMELAFDLSGGAE